jgi:hypothetical protein
MDGGGCLEKDEEKYMEVYKAVVVARIIAKVWIAMGREGIRI